MGKLLLLLSFISLIILVFGSLIAPNSSAMWLANTSMVYVVLRLVLASGILALIVTNPPRKIILRAMTGVMAFGILLFAIYLTYAGILRLLDGMSFAASGVAMGIAALEVNYNKAANLSPKNLARPSLKGAKA